MYGEWEGTPAERDDKVEILLHRSLDGIGKNRELPLRGIVVIVIVCSQKAYQ